MNSISSIAVEDAEPIHPEGIKEPFFGRNG